MTEFAELEQRITAALARISAGLDRWPSPGAAPSAVQGDQIAHLQAALDAERASHAALAPAPAHAPPQGEVDRLTRALDAQGLDNQRLRSSVAQLREEVRRLREAAEPGLTDAALVNRALHAELEALRAARASETTEIAEILAALAPLIDAEEARSHAGH